MPAAPVKIFYSYSHKDEELRNRLETALAQLKRQRLIAQWHDRKILPGDEFDDEISEHLNSADLILLLVSPDFIASDYCIKKEMRRAMARHRAKSARVIPIVLRPTLHEGAPFMKLKGLPTDARPVTVWPDLDSAFLDIAKGIKKAVEEIRAARKGGSTGAPGSGLLRPKAGKAADLSVLPYLPSRAFTGRKEELQAVRDALTAEGRAALTALHGMGGVGKTQIALEYAREQAGDYSVVGWLRAEEPAVLAGEVTALAVRVGLVSADTKAEDARLALRQWLEDTPGVLVIFDNVPKPEVVRDYLPRRGDGAHILITSRYPDWSDLTEPIQVEKWQPEEGADFLITRAKRKEDERAEALAVATELGGLPLALEQAAAYVRKTGETFAGYLDLLREDPMGVLDEYPPDDYRRSAARTFALAFEEVKRESSGAADLLRACAFLSPDEIPGTLLRDYAGTWPGVLNATRHDRLTWGRAVSALRDLALLTAERDQLNVHRVVQLITRDQMSIDEQSVWAGAAFNAVGDQFPKIIMGNVGVWPSCAMLTPHALAVIDHVTHSEVETMSSATLLNRVGLYAYARADYLGAEKLFRRVLATRESTLGLSHPATLQSVNNLAALLEARGDLDGAEPLYRRALAGNESALGLRHPDTLLSVNNLAHLLQARGDLDGAEPLYRRAFAEREELLGPDHPDTLASVNNLAHLLQARGDLDGAEPLFRRALAGNESALGLGHPDTLRSVSNLGSLLRARGDLNGAEPLLRRALEYREATLGPTHPDTLLSVNNFAALLEAHGDLDGAESLLRRALTGRELALGPSHPDTLTSVNDLAALLRARKDLDGAEAFYRRALVGYEATLGPSHPYTLTSVNNLAMLLQARGDLDGAELLYRRALEGFEAKLGPEHPSTRIVRDNLGSLLHEKQERDAASDAAS